ncbi:MULTISPECIES: hypothetical protein [Aeromonas]|uniref:hypothetical protein n=1 Tax=Aeromonas TaxID=642 RepID=UPI0019085F95|nr:hypothetical protein [Aeromonas caviae]MDH0349905.1 hypothetical protein [Aeromonas caviae]QQM77040.1 hypothetical protein JH254_07175 [Aeromonas caviae]QQV19090.1 hypothetical protein JJJ22_18295 [Aeromonas caviae]
MKSSNPINVKAIYILLVFIMNIAYANPQVDVLAKQLGFNSEAHYQRNKAYCLDLFSNEVTSKSNTNCGTNMQCYQSDAAMMNQRFASLMRSKNWSDFGCDIIMQVEAGSNTRSSGDYYEIEVAYNDEFFVINSEKFKAQTYCLGWEEGDQVKFLDGSPDGICTSAELLNIDRNNDTCDVWCE